MFEYLSLFQEFIDGTSQIFTGKAPWWVYLLIALIPVCILVTVREVSCWFFKVNKFLRKVDRIDKRLAVLTGTMEELLRVIKTDIQRNKIQSGSKVLSDRETDNDDLPEIKSDYEFTGKLSNRSKEISGSSYHQSLDYEDKIPGRNNYFTQDDPPSEPFTLGLKKPLDPKN
ncbi:MAG TPA: hypothetical protein PKA63_04890 [Oligoflexia bacterium]|nr:hypothetical protein [Oligoflexia bacterium]HMP47987.1 hypothetical protein [Oligoflexia bacterium]